MRIALGQLKINWENKDANLEKLKVCLEDLAGTRIDLLLLPEMSLTGFSMNTEKTKEREKETVCRVRKLAEAYHTAIGTGWVKDTGEFCENHYSMISADGELLELCQASSFQLWRGKPAFQRRWDTSGMFFAEFSDRSTDLL